MTLRQKTSVLMACALFAAAVHVVHAQSPARGADASAAPASETKRVCVDAEVNGQHALSYDCLSQQLEPKPAAAGAASGTAAEGLAKQPSNKVGTFNLSGERNRFGTNWGKSATPQRPAAPVVVPPR